MDKLKAINDEEVRLLGALANKEREAIQTLYKDNFGMVQTYILNNSGSSEDARDIFQEAMIVLYEKAISGSFELNCQIKTYVFSVCRRLWLKRLQQLKRYTVPVESLEEVIPVEEEFENHEEQQQAFQMMDKAMNNLGDPCKSLLEAYYIRKKNMQEIAGEFGYTNADNAKTQKYKCLVRLKKIFFTHYKNGN